jgi:hypothetical protein
MKGATVSCDTTKLSNGSCLFWQFNCDKIWLTLLTTSKEKFVVDEVPVDLYNYTYRLGFHLIKEFNKTVLFRSGCSASGPCSYTLIDKSDGKKVRTFDQLICIDTDILLKGAHPYEFPFVVYLSREHLVVYFVDSDRVIEIPFEEKLTAIVPERQFESMLLEKKLLTLSYKNVNVRKTLSIKLD